jgi:hypothetical protein
MAKRPLKYLDQTWATTTIICKWHNKTTAAISFGRYKKWVPSASQSDFNANQHLCLLVDPSLLDCIIRQGCEKAIAAEPNLTKWDMVMGDGDCGEAVFGVSTGITLSPHS